MSHRTKAPLVVIGVIILLAGLIGTIVFGLKGENYLLEVIVAGIFVIAGVLIISYAFSEPPDYFHH